MNENKKKNNFFLYRLQNKIELKLVLFKSRTCHLLIKLRELIEKFYRPFIRINRKLKRKEKKKNAKS